MTFFPAKFYLYIDEDHMDLYFLSSILPLSLKETVQPLVSFVLWFLLCILHSFFL